MSGHSSRRLPRHRTRESLSGPKPLSQTAIVDRYRGASRIVSRYREPLSCYRELQRRATEVTTSMFAR